LTVTGDDGFRLFLNGRPVVDEWTTTSRARAKSAAVDLEAGKAYDLRLEFFEAIRDAEARLAWTPPGASDPFQAAVDAARASDVVIFVGGLTGDVEGEEMDVTLPGFAGGDRTDIALPANQEKLLRAVHGTGKPVVLVLTSGSALGVNWAKQNVPAILVAWYPGQRGGNAIADVLFGDISPSGRLPVTFYESVEQLPPFSDYNMKGRTYRYFEGNPLYAFGHGLSYTQFEYSDMRLDKPEAGSSDAVTVSVRVKNTGQRAGHEVVQVYVRAVDPPVAMPSKELRGFRRIALGPGEQQEVRFELVPNSALARYDEAQKTYVVDPGEYEIQVGASSQDIRLRGRLRVR
jgi:beta-glucosidase